MVWGMDAEVTEGIQGERVTQFSVFVENRVGRLLDLVRLLEVADIHILAISVVDTVDAAIDRFVTDDPDRTRTLLEEHGWAFNETAVVVAELDMASDLRKLLTALFQGECNLHFIYPLMSRPREKPCMVLHVEDDDCARAVLKSAGIRTLNQNDISR